MMKDLKILEHLNISSLKKGRLTGSFFAFFRIILPLLAGTGLAYQATKTLSPVFLLLTLLCGALIQLYIILMHDYSAAEAAMLPRGDVTFEKARKLITRKIIQQKLMRRMGVATALGIILLGWALTFFGGRTYALPLLLLSMLFIHGYYFYPFHLYYRGLGEILEVLGAGLLLPLLGFHLGGAPFAAYFPLISLIPVILISTVSTLTIGIRRFPGDLIAGKKTFPLLYGTAATRRIIIGLLAASIALCAIFYSLGIYRLYALLLGTVMPFFFLVDIFKEFKTATHEYPASLKRFKTLIGYAVSCTYLGLILSFMT